jgi:hypothetical protein
VGYLRIGVCVLFAALWLADFTIFGGPDADRLTQSVEPLNRLFAYATLATLYPLAFFLDRLEGVLGPDAFLVTIALNAILWGYAAGGLVSLWAFSRRRVRQRRGRCPACGYDLRGSPSAPGSDGKSKTCPECGAASPLSRRTNPA